MAVTAAATSTVTTLVTITRRIEAPEVERVHSGAGVAPLCRNVDVVAHGRLLSDRWVAMARTYGPAVNGLPGCVKDV